MDTLDISDALLHFITQFTTVLDLSGALVNGILSGVIAKRARLDITGVLSIGIIGAVGGGIIRDLILDQGPPAAFQSNWYIVLAILGGLLAWYVSQASWFFRVWDKISPHIDALVLGMWSVVGVQKALLAGMGILQAALLGILTAVGGGIIRDVMLQRKPAVFGGETLYLTPAIWASAVTAVFLCFVSGVWALPAATLIALIITGTIVPLAKRRNWVLKIKD